MKLEMGQWIIQQFVKELWKIAAPQPAEPVKEVSDKEILALAASEHLGQFDKHGKLETCWSQPCDIDDEVLAFARALLSKYAAPQLQQQSGEPVVPPVWETMQYGGKFVDMTAGQGYRLGWNDCRAEMLKANPQAARQAQQDPTATRLCRLSRQMPCACSTNSVE